MMPEDEIDLSPLRPADERAAEERVVGGVTARIRAAREPARFGTAAGAIPELVDAEESDLLTLVGRLTIPALVAAAIVGVAAGLVLYRTRAVEMRSVASRAQVPSAAAALGVDATVARWASVVGGSLPPAADIVTSFGGRR